MPMNTKTIFIHLIYIMILSHINTITVMVRITTPNKIMMPQQLFSSIIISEKSIDTQYRCREVYIFYLQSYYKKVKCGKK